MKAQTPPPPLPVAIAHSHCGQRLGQSAGCARTLTRRQDCAASAPAEAAERSTTALGPNKAKATSNSVHSLLFVCLCEKGPLFVCECCFFLHSLRSQKRDTLAFFTNLTCDSTHKKSFNEIICKQTLQSTSHNYSKTITLSQKQVSLSRLVGRHKS